MMAYAKGARTFERHIDIEADGIAVSPYCSLPEQVDKWFKAFNKAKEMCGGPGTSKRIPSAEEIEYLDALVRGVYAKRDLPQGHALTRRRLLPRHPAPQGAVSCRELIRGESACDAGIKNQPITIDHFDNPYSRARTSVT